MHGESSVCLSLRERIEVRVDRSGLLRVENASLEKKSCNPVQILICKPQ